MHTLQENNNFWHINLVKWLMSQESSIAHWKNIRTCNRKAIGSFSERLDSSEYARVISFIIELSSFLFLHRFLNSNRNFAHINLALSLILAELLFVLGIDKTQNQVRCSIVLFVFVVSFFSFFALQFLLNESSKNQVLVISWHAILCHVMISVWSHFTACHQFGITSRHLISLMSYYVMSCHPLCIVMWCDQLHVMSCLITLMLRHARLVSSLCADIFGVLK